MSGMRHYAADWAAATMLSASTKDGALLAWAEKILGMPRKEYIKRAWR
jgi:hypothetical protein